MTFEEALKHTGKLMTVHARKRALEALPHYIWTTGTPQKRSGFCTACMRWIEDINPDKGRDRHYHKTSGAHSESERKGFYTAVSGAGLDWDSDDRYEAHVSGDTKHKSYGWCPRCGARIQYRSMGMGRNTFEDKVFVITYRKSRIEKGAIVCIGYAVDAPWWDMYNAKKPPIVVEPYEVCVFRPGKGGQRFCGESNWYSDDKKPTFYKRNECKSGFTPYAICGQDRRAHVLDLTSFENAIEGTEFGRMLALGIHRGASQWNYIDKIRVLDRIARYPCIEYLHKLGYTDLAHAVINSTTERVLNLRGKTAKGVLRLTDGQWSEIRGKKLKVSIRMLKIKDMAMKNHWRLNMEACEWLSQNTDQYYFNKLDGYHNLNPVKLVKYCQKHKSSSGFRVGLNDYCDYLGQLKMLSMPFSKENMYPRDFHEMHYRLSDRIRHKKDELLDAKIKGLVGKLQHFCYAAHGMILRPMESSLEIIEEGTKLHHCVGSYVQRYAEGGTVLCCLRREGEPDVPLYTVEFSTDGHMVQCRGSNNRTCPEDQPVLDAFWQDFNATLKDRIRQLKKAAVENKKKARNAA